MTSHNAWNMLGKFSINSDYIIINDYYLTSHNTLCMLPSHFNSVINIMHPLNCLPTEILSLIKRDSLCLFLTHSIKHHTLYKVSVLLMIESTLMVLDSIKYSNKCNLVPGTGLKPQ